METSECLARMDANEIPRSARRRERLRRLIIEEASRLYVENGGENGGVESATVELISENADISVRTFFRYFDSKLDVIYLDYRRATDDLVNLLKTQLETEEPELALLNASVAHALAFISDHVNRERLIRSLTSHYFQERLAVWRMHSQRALIEVIRPRVKEPAAALRSTVMVTTLRGVIDNALGEWVKNPKQDIIGLIGDAVAELPRIGEAAIAATATLSSTRAKGRPAATRKPSASPDRPIESKPPRKRAGSAE